MGTDPSYLKTGGTTEMTNSYLRFLHLADTLINPNDKPLDSLSKDILEHISKHIVLNKGKIVIGDILMLSQLGSQATLHKRLHALVDDGYLKLKSTNDGRVKQIELTKKANKYFAGLSQALEKAVKA
jgi:DNA-binding MarR family transcriptional regulator